MAALGLVAALNVGVLAAGARAVEAPRPAPPASLVRGPRSEVPHPADFGLRAADFGPARQGQGVAVKGLPSAAAEPSPSATRELLRTVAPPPRDESDLVRRFKQACGTPTAEDVPLYRDEALGDTRAFWVLDEPNRRYFEVQATLRHASEHVLFYVQDGVSVPRESLAASAVAFEQKTYPLLRQYFGDPPTEPRLTVFNGRVPGVGGYFSASDLHPRSVNPYSNERPIVFMSVDAARPGTPAYDSVLAHETQHFVHWLAHPQQDAWINEGASELAMAVAGFDQTGVAQSFLNRPETQLNAWSARPTESVPYYGAGYLMLEYFAQRLGGYEQVKRLIASPGASVGTFNSFFAREPAGLSFDDLFRDFVIANLLNDRTIADGRFGYEKLALRARVQERYDRLPASAGGVVRPYATRYVELLPAGQRGDLRLRFEGAADARLFPAAPYSGRVQWWGNAADEMESTLTREFDLTRVPRATLRFAAWFDTEPDYDYAGVAVSTDGGCTWRTLPGRHTTDSNPVGQNLGYGFTGHSGGGATPEWVDEAMDLTPYAGQRVLVRFFYATDQSYHAVGVAIDDVAIPEIGFFDDAETDQGWSASGFLRAVNAAALDWAVQVVAFADGGPQILQLPTAPGAGGRLEGALTIPRFGDGVSRVVVAISPLVPVTLEGAEFRLEAQLG